MFTMPDKDPDEVLEYTFDWRAATNGTPGARGDVLEQGETISGAPAVTVPAGLTKDSQTNDDDTVTVWLSGGTAGMRYTVGCRIVTSQSRTYDRSIVVPVRAR